MVKQLVTRPNRFRIGIDVGWRLQLADGPYDMYWGNIKNTDSLRLLIEDARRRGHEFELAPETLATLRGETS
jgi:hypothetical protein